MVTDHLLINEIKLGIKLNQCVHENRRSDFSLMLAMLTEDAREFSEFCLPTAHKHTPQETVLRKKFQLPNQQALALENMNQITQYNEVADIQQNNMSAIHLNNALSPKPLSFKNNSKHIPNNVLSNMNVHSQERYLMEKNNNRVNQPVSFNAVGWLNSIENSMTENTLTGVSA